MKVFFMLTEVGEESVPSLFPPSVSSLALVLILVGEPIFFEGERPVVLAAKVFFLVTPGVVPSCLLRPSGDVYSP